ncbi:MULTISPECIES: O-antigen ligase family protein [Parabacteroides]|uniref:O-antigen ligase family protein n=1 Tax=Parabacteroides provencensis TaxID=1944636 RepID=UPI000C152C60|nr:O-antigen ligase family protein [Parabacteroides provencensis]
MKPCDNTYIRNQFSINLLYILFAIGLGGIGVALIFNNLALGIIIATIPLICILSIYILQIPTILLFVIFTVNYFIMGINRYVNIEGISVLMDILYALAITLVFMHSTLLHDIEWKRAINILTISSFIWMIYCILELINPSAVFHGWILSRNLIINGLIISVLTSLLCTRYKTIQTLLIIFSLFTIIAAIKAIIQKFIGFDLYERIWLVGNTTHLLSTGTRYFSFFTDASNLGANMGCAGILFGISAFYIRTKWLKIYYLIVSILATYTMFLSGTRGAMIVPIAGLALFILISKNTKAIITGGSTLIFIYIFFAFTTIGQGNTMIRRMRTAFTPTKDASFNVRKENQRKLGTYLKHKPFGEGLGLSGDGLGWKISRRFTTSIPTDSWYVKIWVETGVVGLVIYLGMIFISIGKGAWILAYKIRDPELKGQLTGWLCGIFGMFISAYGNSFWGQFPTMIIAFMGLTIVLNAKYFDNEINCSSSTINTSK